MKPMQFTASAAAIVALLLAGWATSSRATQPLVTDNADALEAGDCQWHYNRDSAKVAGLKARGWTTQVGCGVGGNTQLDAAFSRADGNGQRADAFAVQGKTQTVRSSEPGGTSVAVAYGWLGERERGTSTRTDSLSLGLLVSKPLAPKFTAHLNLGWLKVKDVDSTVTWGLAGEYRLTDRLDVAAETFGEDGSRPWMALGVRWRCGSRRASTPGMAFSAMSPGSR